MLGNYSGYKYTDLAVQYHAVAMGTGLREIVFDMLHLEQHNNTSEQTPKQQQRHHTLFLLCYYFVRLHRLEAPAEELEPSSLFVHLHALPVILDLRVHPVGAFFHCRGNRTTCLSLGIKSTAHSCYHQFLALTLLLPQPRKQGVKLLVGVKGLARRDYRTSGGSNMSNLPSNVLTLYAPSGQRIKG